VAEIWVRIDTIFADSSSQMIWMYSGNNDAQSLSDGTKVFGSANGYRSVWHLGENTTSSVVGDAVGSFDGVLKSVETANFTESVSSPNIIGNGFEFPDWTQKNWIDLGPDKAFLNDLEEFTFSLWVNLYSSKVKYPNIIALSIYDDGGVPRDSRILMHLKNDSLHLLVRSLDNADQLRGISIDPGVSLEQWNYITGVINLAADSMKVYMNGSPLKSIKADFQQNKMDSGNSTLGAIGATDNGLNNYFAGKLDEIRLENTARSEEWVKLCYENQKMDGNLITIKPVH